MSSIVKGTWEVGMKYPGLLFGSSKNKIGYAAMGQNSKLKKANRIHVRINAKQHIHLIC